MKYIIGLLMLIGGVDCYSATKKTAELTPLITTGEITKIMFALFLVIVFVVILSLIARKLNGLTISQSKHMRTISGLSLSAKEKIVLVEVADKQFLLGVSPGGISKLKEFEERIDFKKITDDESFLSKFKKIYNARQSGNEK